MSSYLFVTGMPRSGTTLLDKLLSLHPQAIVLSQPLPLLYVRVKRDFLESAGLLLEGSCASRYPLNDMAGANYYRPAKFLDFLRAFRPTRKFCRQLLQEMQDYSGQCTRPDNPGRVLERIHQTSFFDLIASYTECLIGGVPPPVIGSKEIACEEYLPYLSAGGARVVQIVRDPRDVIASLDYGRGEHFGGRSKPLLFNIRQWRKSVAFALAGRYEGQGRHLTVRYEDLVRESKAVMGRICRFLRLDEPAEDLFDGELRDQNAQVWHSNSSHHSSSVITTQSLGRYRSFLSTQTDMLVQAICYREMLQFGYEITISEQEVAPIIERYRPSETLERPELACYLWSPQRRDEELRRSRCLREGRFEASLFIFDTAFALLRATAAGLPGDTVYTGSAS